jgi:hypothetical protein
MLSTADFRRVQLAHLYFVGAMDFPGVQESNVKCLPEPTRSGRSYTGALLLETGDCEVSMYNNGALVMTRQIPKPQIRQYEFA